MNLASEAGTQPRGWHISFLSDILPATHPPPFTSKVMAGGAQTLLRTPGTLGHLGLLLRWEKVTRSPACPPEAHLVTPVTHHLLW